MLGDDIKKVEDILYNKTISLEFSVDENNIEYFDFLHFGPSGFKSETLVEMTFGMSLSWDRYSVDLVKFNKMDMSALVFNSAMADGRFELMGLTAAHAPDAAFIQHSITRWTRVENFKWPENLVINRPELLPLLFMDQLRSDQDDE